jgi:hypothetical protein
MFKLLIPWRAAVLLSVLLSAPEWMCHAQVRKSINLVLLIMRQ